MTEAHAARRPPAGRSFTRPQYRDGRALRILPSLQRDVSAAIRSCAIVDVFLLEGIPPLSPAVAAEVFCDSVAQEMLTEAYAAGQPTRARWDYLVEITVKPGCHRPRCADRPGCAVRVRSRRCPMSAVVQTAVQYLVATAGAAVDAGELSRFFHNPLIQSATCISRAEWNAGTQAAPDVPARCGGRARRASASSSLPGMTDAELSALSRERLLALSLPEMHAVRAYFARSDGRRRSAAQRGLPSAATDVELEMIAQTWSEHCKHKIFNATIHSRERGREETIRSLFKTFIRSTTEDDRPRSADSCARCSTTTRG